MKRVAAFSFRSRLALEDLFAKLNELGPWRWIERDNDRFGGYISARALPEPDYGIVKIFVEPDHYVVDLVLESDAHTKLDAVYDTLFTYLLPALGANDVRETDHRE